MSKTIKSAKKKQRKQSKFPWLIWFLAVVSVAVWWSLYQSKWFLTETVTIQGLSRLSADQVSVIANAPTGKPLVGQDLTGISDRLKDLPEIKAVLVERGWPTTLLITITERVPIAVAATATGFNLIDNEGKNSGVVVAPPEGLLVIAAAPESAAMTSAISILAALPADWPITSLAAPSQDNVVVNLATGAVITFGSGNDAEQKVKVANALLAQNYLTINVSAPASPSVR
jgi:cell division protein FtsQ